MGGGKIRTKMSTRILKNLFQKEKKEKRQGGIGIFEREREKLKKDSPPLLVLLKPLQLASQPDAPHRSPE